MNAQFAEASSVELNRSIDIEEIMKLVLKRTQRAAGMLGNKVAFGLNARIDLTSEEKADVAKYRLGSELVYSSESRKRHIEKAQGINTGEIGVMRGVAALAAASLSLKCTIDSLTAGQYIECKDLPELLGAEEAVREGCQVLKTYLAAAATFDGREQIVEI